MQDLTIAQLASIYETVFGVKPPTKWTKAQLIEAIEKEEDKELVDHEITKEDIENNPELSDEGVKEGDVVQFTKDPIEEGESGTFPSNEEETLPEGILAIVKVDEFGDVIDSSTTTKDAWELLPSHKYGWKLAPPKELL